MSEIWNYPVIYYALIIEEDSEIKEFLKRYVSNPCRSFHVTLIHKDQIGYDEVENWINENFGKEFDLELTEFCYNEKIGAFRVKGDFLTANKIPHITATYTGGILPIEANTMLMTDYLSVPCSIKVHSVLLGV